MKDKFFKPILKFCENLIDRYSIPVIATIRKCKFLLGHELLILSAILLLLWPLIPVFFVGEIAGLSLFLTYLLTILGLILVVKSKMLLIQYVLLFMILLGQNNTLSLCYPSLAHQNTPYCVCSSAATVHKLYKNKKQLLFTRDLCDCNILKIDASISQMFRDKGGYRFLFLKRFKSSYDLSRRLDLRVPFYLIYSEELKKKIFLEFGGNVELYLKHISNEINDSLNKKIVDGVYDMDSAKYAAQQCVREILAENQYVELPEAFTMQECVIN